MEVLQLSHFLLLALRRQAGVVLLAGGALEELALAARGEQVAAVSAHTHVHVFEELAEVALALLAFDAAGLAGHRRGYLDVGLVFYWHEALALLVGD